MVNLIENAKKNITNIKEKIEKFKEKRSFEENIRNAKKLKGLREERIKLEGKAKIENLKQKEEKKLLKAKEIINKGKSNGFNFLNGMSLNNNQKQEKSELLNSLGNFNLNTDIGFKGKKGKKMEEYKYF